MICALLLTAVGSLAYFMFRGLFVDDSNGYWTYR
jgi:hypothetical protein